ncbi:hypothetical protein CSPX01_12852 [Colletotrichum filicis]|nr:hypothetical protein CSPX01_12852 [Colletotrichum filicis]
MGIALPDAALSALSVWQSSARRLALKELSEYLATSLAFPRTLCSDK